MEDKTACSLAALKRPPTSASINPMATLIGLAELELHLPGVSSLKEKRGIVRSLLKRVQKSFNVSVAEVDYMDTWQSAKIALVAVSNSSAHAHKTLQTVLNWIEEHYPDVYVMRETTEII